VKVVHPHLANDPGFVRMFVDEAMLSARIQHPNVVHVEELGEVAAFVGGLAFALLGPQASQAPLIGASGAVSGIIAAYLMLYPKVTVWVLIAWRIPIPLTAAWCLGAWIAFQFWQLAFASDTSNVAWLAHIGGLAAGVIFVVILKRGDVPLFGRA